MVLVMRVYYAEATSGRWLNRRERLENKSLLLLFLRTEVSYFLEIEKHRDAGSWGGRSFRGGEGAKPLGSP
jgi:hypothetical protein